MCFLIIGQWIVQEGGRALAGTASIGIVKQIYACLLTVETAVPSEVHNRTNQHFVRITTSLSDNIYSCVRIQYSLEVISTSSKVIVLILCFLHDRLTICRVYKKSFICWSGSLFGDTCYWGSLSAMYVTLGAYCERWGSWVSCLSLYQLTYRFPQTNHVSWSLISESGDRKRTAMPQTLVTKLINILDQVSIFHILSSTSDLPVLYVGQLPVIVFPHWLMR